MAKRKTEKRKAPRPPKASTALYAYWQDNDRFADLFNHVLFGGHDYLKPGRLSEKDTDQSAVIRGKDGSFRSVERHRDIIKSYAGDTDFVIVGIENQSYVDYTMPVRNMVYDGLNYARQCRELGVRDPARRGADEFLSKAGRESRIRPAVTLVIYHGEKAEWDGPHKLSDMMDIPGEIRPYFNDYRINVFSIRSAGGISFGNKDNQTLFAVTEYHFRKGKGFDIAEFEKEFPALEINAETLAAVGALTDCADYMEYAHQNKEKEEINMCEAVKAIREKGMKEGIEQGIEQGISQGIEQGISQGIEQGISQGIEQGISRGIDQGFTQAALLYEYLFNNNKTEELQKSFRDVGYQKELIARYNICD